MSKIMLASREVAAVDYNPVASELLIEMRKGSAYRVQNVPPIVYNTLVASESPGTYYHLHIRKGNYEISRLR